MFRQIATRAPSRWITLACSCVLILCGAERLDARTRPAYGGTLRVETQGEAWRGADSIGRRLTMDGLTDLGADGEVTAALATRWSSQNADHRWEFKLRSNVHFHDGTALTGEVAAASLAKSCADDCPWTTVRAVGSSVIFTGDSPMPELPALLAGAKFLIAHPADAHPSGTGPFIAAPSDSDVAAFKANEDCWRGRPFLDTVELRSRRSIREQWLDLSVGRADVVEVPAALLPQARQQRLTVISSGPVDLLVLQLSPTGPLANEKLRHALALAVDRSALYNVIFQKQGEVTASLMPDSLSGYSFLFPTDRDLSRSQELRGGATPQVTLAPEDSNPELQLSVERVAINLREAGFKVQVVSSTAHSPDIVLRRIHLEASTSRAGLEDVLSKLGFATTGTSADPAALYRAERDFLAQFTAVPLVYLPRAYSTGERVRDLRLAADGTPLFADAAVEVAH